MTAATVGCPVPPQAPQGLREIRLHGVLGKRFGRVHRLAVETAAEAVQALCAVIDGFEAHLRKYSEPGYKLWVGERNLALDELPQPCGTREVIRIVPVVRGSKRAGLGQTIVGYVLVVVGTVLTAYGYGSVGVPLAQTGFALMVGGVIQMLSPQRKGQDAAGAENKPSYNFGGPVNVTTEGGCVPLCYGRMIVGSVVISGGMSVDDISPPPPAPPIAPEPLPDDQANYGYGTGYGGDGM